MSDDDAFREIGRAFVRACIEEARKRGYPGGVWSEQQMVAKAQLAVQEQWQRVDEMPTYRDRKKARRMKADDAKEGA